MRQALLLVAVCVLPVSAFAQPTPPSTTAEADWQPLFNGKNLDGWYANFDPQAFRVEEGLLRVHGVDNRAAHLFYVGETEDTPVKFKNFELRIVARAEPKSNSGLFFHTSKELRNKARHLNQGYEIQLNSDPDVKDRTGSLYDIENAVPKTLDEGDWFELLLRVEGKHVTVTIDGEVVIDYTEPDDVQRPAGRKGRVIQPEGGGIALQAHDRHSVWYFKEVAIRVLD